MSLAPELLERFDPRDPDFIADPYPVFADLREAAPIFWYEPSRQWFVTRHSLVHSTLRDRRLGRAYLHRYTDQDLGRPEPDPRWAAFHDSERWSLLNLEPPDHTRLRGLVTKVFTPRSVAALRPGDRGRAPKLARRLPRARPSSTCSPTTPSPTRWR